MLVRKRTRTVGTEPVPRELTFDPAHFDDGFLSPAYLEEVDRALYDKIVDAVESLPDVERDIVELTMWGRYTKTEAAGILGRSRQSVHDAWLRALDMLREVLRDAV